MNVIRNHFQAHLTKNNLYVTLKMEENFGVVIVVSESRKQQILDLIRRDGSVRVATLSQLFEVSEVTVRNYLTDMESKGLLTRTHGGAISSYKPYCSMNFNQRLETNHIEKDIIAKKIALMIEPNDTVMLNAGTTTLLVFRHLPAEYHLNIITNSISIALEASANPNFNIVLIGGSVNSKYQFTFGSDATSILRKYYADKLILSVDGIDFNGGFSTYYNEEIDVDRQMLEQSSVSIIAADRSKFGRNAMAKISDLSTADFIVTTYKPDKNENNVLYDNGITVINVK